MTRKILLALLGFGCVSNAPDLTLRHIPYPQFKEAARKLFGEKTDKEKHQEEEEWNKIQRLKEENGFDELNAEQTRYLMSEKANQIQD